MGKVTTERTEAGEQTVIPGAEKITDRALAERIADKPLRSTKPQQPADFGLFGDSHKQKDLF